MYPLCIYLYIHNIYIYIDILHATSWPEAQGHPSIRDVLALKITLHFLSVGVADAAMARDRRSVCIVGGFFFPTHPSMYKLLIQPKSNPNHTRASCKKGTVNMVVPLVTKQPAWEGGSCPDSCPFACAIKTTALIIIFRAMAIQIMATDDGPDECFGYFGCQEPLTVMLRT